MKKCEILTISACKLEGLLQKQMNNLPEQQLLFLSSIKYTKLGETYRLVLPLSLGGLIPDEDRKVMVFRVDKCRKEW